MSPAMSVSPAGMRRRSRRAVIPGRAKREPGISNFRVRYCASPRNDVEELQRNPSILPIAQARFLQIEVALDPAPCFVGDLAVAQQRVDELAFRRDQFARQRGAGRRGVVLVWIERVGQLVGTDFMPRAQQLDDLVGEFAVVGDGVERFERLRQSFAPRRSREWHPLPLLRLATDRGFV